MSNPYQPAMARFATLLAAAAPDRKVTRSFRDFLQLPPADLNQGVLAVVCGGIAGYGYEASGDLAFDGPNQTELGRLQFSVIGQGQLPEGAPGEDIEAAELAMLEQLEAFADRGINDETLKDLLLTGATFSQQVEAPYYWLKTDWQLRLFS